MPDVQNVFSFPPVFSQAQQTQQTQQTTQASAGAPAQGVTDGSKPAQKDGAKKDGSAAPESDFLACFLAVLEQSAAAEKENIAAEGEPNGDKPLFSGSIQDLLTPLRNTLQQEMKEMQADGDLDLDTIFKQLDALWADARDRLPGLNADNLKALLPKVRDFVLKHPEACAAIIDEFSRMLNEQPLQNAEAVKAPEQNAEDKETEEAKNAPAETEENLPELSSLEMSRLYSYLKPEALRDAAKGKEPAEDNAAETDAKVDQTAVPVIVPAEPEKADKAKAVVAKADTNVTEALLSVVSEVSRKEAPAEPKAEKTETLDKPDKTGKTEAAAQTEKTAEVKSEGEPQNASRRVAAARDNAQSAGEKNSDEPSQKKAPPERAQSFSQFFDGVMARREQPDARFEVNDLKFSEAPLARGEALREGVSNVVRFIRASGEQKASLIVDPPALGRITVELSSTATGLEAAIKVSSEQIRQLVQEQISQLRFSLEQQGVQLTQFSVDVQQDSGQRQQEQQGSQGRRSVSGGDDIEEEETVFGVDLNEGLLYWVA